MLRFLFFLCRWWIFSGLAARVRVFFFGVEDTEGMSIFKKKEYSAERSATRMARALAVMGALHFIIPGPFDSIIPKYLPGPRHAYTHGSGVAELGTAALLSSEKTRRAGGLLAALLFVAVFPANIQMAVDARNQSTQRKAIAYGRLPLQLPMICSALKIWRKSK